MGLFSGLLYLSIFLLTIIGMEGVAAVTHRYVMHGCLWVWHESHHMPRSGGLEKNDWFVVLFASPAILLIYLGVQGHPALLAMGLGMTTYGALYFVFHDFLVHQRLPWRYQPKSDYLKRIVKAHHRHHAQRTRLGCTSFGFLYARPHGKNRSAQQVTRL